MTPSTLQIPELIRALRKRLNLSQEKFAARLGVSFQTINRWEKGRTTPSPMAIKVDDLEQERAQKAELVGKSYESILDEAYRWSYWAVPKLPNGEINRNNFLVGDDLEVNAE